MPFQPTVDTQLSNEIEFHKSNELLVPGKQKTVNRTPSFTMGFRFFGGFLHTLHGMFLEWRNTAKNISNNTFHVYLIREFQKYAGNQILTMGF